MPETPTSSADLLELLDLEERQLLASELGLPAPASLRDAGFQDSITAFSSTTLLLRILRLRRPFLVMLKEIDSFLSDRSARGRTTSRTVLLPGEVEAEVRLVFDQGLQSAIATFLDMRLLTEDVESLVDSTTELRTAIDELVRAVRGSWVQSSTEVSRIMRHNPMLSPVARSFDRMRHVYHPSDTQRIASLHHHVTLLRDDLTRLRRTADRSPWMPSDITEEISGSVNQMRRLLENKRHEMEAFQRRSDDRWGPRPELEGDRSDQILERVQRLRERVLAACEFENVATPAYDFLNLYLWKQKWRMYEVWMLVHVLNVLARLGLQPDISNRVTEGIWDLRFTRDQSPVARLVGDCAALLLYYQRFVRSTEGGDMPDIILTEQNGGVLVILDPKCGRSYSQKELADVAHRYAGRFHAKLSVVHNYYPVEYDVEACNGDDVVVIGNIQPGTKALRALDDLIRNTVPADLIPPGVSLVAVVDVSGSTAHLRTLFAKVLHGFLARRLGGCLPGSQIVLFDTAVRDRIAIAQAATPQEIEGVMSRCGGGGTDLAGAIREGVRALSEMPRPRQLVILSDGQDSKNVRSLASVLDTADVELVAFDRASSDQQTGLAELCALVDGEYESLADER